MSTEMKLWEAVDQNGAEQKYNVIRPSESILAPNPLMTVYANIVTFTEADTYPVDGGKVALNGVALSKIASGAGISFVDVSRMDDGRNPDVAEVKVLAVMKRADGSMIYATGQKRVDVAAYAAQELASKLKKNQNAKPNEQKSEDQIRRDVETNRLQLSKFRAERAETGAKSRAIRQLLGMKSSYTKAELAKPFVIPQVTVNMAEIVKDEFGRKLAIQQALGASNMLFGTTSPGMATPAALPDGGAAPAALPPAVSSGDDAETSPAPTGPTQEEVQIDEWKNARPGERSRKLGELLETRVHGLKEAAVDELYTKDAAYQAKMIVWLMDKPERDATPTNAPTNGTQANGTPPPTPPSEDAPTVSGPVGGNGWTMSEKQSKRLFAIAKVAGYDSAALHDTVARLYGGITSLSDLTRDQYEELCGKDDEPGHLQRNPFTLAASSKDTDLPF